MAASYRPQLDDDLVRHLIDDQFPDWSDLSLHRVEPAGSDHAIYRLGAELAVRVPRHSGAMHEAKKNAHLLPQLAPLLPLQVPVAVAVGSPGLRYPWHWLVCRWLDGEVATAEQLADSAVTAAALADFLIAMHSLDLEVTDEWRGDLTHPRKVSRSSQH